MKENLEYKMSKQIIEDIQSVLRKDNIGLSVHGSSIYGRKFITDHCDDYKPNFKSDIDFMIIANDSQFLNSLKGIINTVTIYSELYDQDYIDMLVARGDIKNKRISFQCVSEKTYEKLCRSSMGFVIVNKELKHKKSRIQINYSYKIFGFHEEESVFSRIIPYQKSHLIIYPNYSHLSNNSFALSVFQDQILTEVDLLDKNQQKYRQSLIDTVIKEANFLNSNPLLLFRERSSNWNDEFKEFMRVRFNGC